MMTVKTVQKEVRKLNAAMDRFTRSAGGIRKAWFGKGHAQRRQVFDRRWEMIQRQCPHPAKRRGEVCCPHCYATT